LQPQVNRYAFILVLLIVFSICPQGIGQENPATLCVSLPAGTTTGPNPNPWLDEGWLLNLTGASWTFNVRVTQAHDTYVSYKTHLVIALNDAAYNSLVNLTVNSITLPKAVFRNGTPKPFNSWTWPNDVYPTWFNDTCINIGSIYPEESIDLTVSVTFLDTTNVKMHFDAYGKTIPCTTPPKLGEITWSPSTCDSTVIPTLKTPVVAFSYAPKPPIASEPVLFDASESYDPDGTIVGYIWDFGDGNTTTTTSPIITHQYGSPETYTVTLSVKDSEGLVNATRETLLVRAYPHAAFTYTPSTPKVEETATFNASTSEPNGGTIICYYWNFDDGSTANATDSIITHTYIAAGGYNVTLTVADSEGLTDMTARTVMVKPLEPPKSPQANFVKSPQIPYVSQLVTFNASFSKQDFDGVNLCPIVWYYWSFGDDVTTNESNPVTKHAYAEAGTYNVTLIIYAPADNSPEYYPYGSTWQTITVSVPVGGYAVPINKFGLIARWVGPASLVILFIVLTTVFVKRRKQDSNELLASAVEGRNCQNATEKEK